jgi:hypothetical protein
MNWLRQWHIFQDAQFGARLLRKNSLFTIVAVFTLALGIGSSTALYSIINSLLLHPRARAGIGSPHADRRAAVRRPWPG